MNIYEYLFTGIIIFAMLVASSTMITQIAQPNQTTSDKEQLKTTTQKIMTQLTLDPGNPPDWGSNITLDTSDMTSFGLAKYGETTRDAYVLDPDKILRLNQTNPLYIQPYDVLNLLNLGNDYGLTLQIYPALNVTANQTPQGTDRYTIAVTTNDIGLPIVNANATARIFYYDTTSQTMKGTNQTLSNSTWIDGQCTIDFTNSSIPTQMKVLTLVVDYYGIRIVKTLPMGTSVTEGYFIDNHILQNQVLAVSSNRAAEIAVNKKAGGGYIIETVTSALTQINDLRFGTRIDLDYVEPSATAVLALANPAALIVASKETNLLYTSISGFTSSPFAYSLERTVIISGSTYTMRLQMWRMSF